MHRQSDRRRSGFLSCHPSITALEERTLLSFLPPVNYLLNSDVSVVAVGDFDSDGNLDLAVASYGGTGSILLGNGDGSLQAPISFEVGLQATSIATGDFTGNGILDLAVASAGGNVNVFLGNGDGTFQAPISYPAGPSPGTVAVADFNGDGMLDLVVTHSGTDTVSVLLGNGNGTFQPRVDYAAGASPRDVAVRDFNGDGVLDLAIADAGSYPYYQDAGVSVLLGNADGTFGPPHLYASPGNPISVAVGDFNGDGIADLTVANVNANAVSVLLGNGDGSFQPSQSFVAGAWNVVVADINGDGQADIAGTLTDPSKVAVLLGNGDGSFQDQLDYDTGTRPTCIATGDFNGDGFPDLVTCSPQQNTVSILINAADWGNNNRPPLQPPLSPSGMAAADRVPSLDALAPTAPLPPRVGTDAVNAAAQNVALPQTAVVTVRQAADSVFAAFADPTADDLAASLTWFPNSVWERTHRNSVSRV
jgi:hypothetical protein